MLEINPSTFHFKTLIANHLEVNFSTTVCRTAFLGFIICNGFGITIETQGTVAFSAIPYTDEDLMNAKHFWEMQARPYTVLHLDAWTRGVGNASCGHDVDTLPEYRVPNKKMTYTLRISKMQ